MATGDRPHGFVSPAIVPYLAGATLCDSVSRAPLCEAGQRTASSRTIVLVLFTVLMQSLFSPGTPLLGQNNGVSPVSNHLWEPVASSRLVDVTPTHWEIDYRKIIGIYRNCEGKLLHSYFTTVSKVFLELIAPLRPFQRCFGS